MGVLFVELIQESLIGDAGGLHAELALHFLDGFGGVVAEVAVRLAGQEEKVDHYAKFGGK